ncbi:MAG: ABC transporter permease [Acutalibacteraceae bacterium]|nr:ABC transporter permease [Oscillospiraceae bacterium]
MTGLGNLIKRNCKLFFKDKGMFFTSLITPLILLVLYSTFLAKVYRDAFVSSIPDFLSVSDKIINGAVGGELLSSLLAVSGITVAFCSNMLMVQDKVTGARRDLTVTPVKRSTLALSYYISTALSTLIICFVAVGAGMLYMLKVGNYISATDALLILLDVILLVLFGTSLSSIVNIFLTTQGQMSAVGTIVSSAYGFICGAYMPISQFGPGLQKALSFLPGTYATSLIRNHTMRGAIAAMGNAGVPADMIESIKDAVDCNIYFFGEKVSVNAMYAVLAGSAAVLIVVYVLINSLRKPQKRK